LTKIEFEVMIYFQMRILRLFLTSLLVFSLSTYVYFANPGVAAAATLNPTFEVMLPDVNPSTSSDMTFTITNPVDSMKVTTTTISIPAGWIIASGNTFSKEAEIGSGSFTASIYGEETTFYFKVINNADLGVHSNRFTVDFDDPNIDPIDDYIDGDSTTGYTLTLDAPPAEYDFLSLPTTTVFTLKGTVEGRNFLTTPVVQGDYTWIADFTGVDGTHAQDTWTPTIPASLTPEGENVTTTFSDGSSVTFASVEVGGGTTQATSELAPKDVGVGQFQLAGGQYYDFTLTKDTKIACPCTVTLSYDPKTTDKPSIYHLEDGKWVDVTTSFDKEKFTVTGTVSSFSWFAVGQPNFSIDWRLPLERPNGRESVFSKRIQILPIIFSLLDADGQYVERDDVTVQVLNSSGEVVSEFSPRLILRDGKFYIAMLKVHQLHLPAGEYTTKVQVGNTTVSPTIDFILK